ncbi:hypothetical protein CI807_07370 [Pseudomonas sp. NS1(2017)]|uniref:DUF4214 domain-containing protein n=1 Tax=Pseudomonas sp. NS1(2017) TaxID=2025658 RepID=UPI000BA23F58|nr:DUF4214 domain-containing protein [Pseudomonas sp. NS1(2017)]ASV36010.1 hypothetical protein CI807_07370 [Pseudomonas sp. NS1(2017)]
MATATNAQKIAGLYAAFFERAPDAAGLSYWEGQFTGNATVNTIAVQFAANPVFAATYGSLTDVQFVNAVYQNVLGAAGDAAGVDYWVSQLKTGGADARANFVAQFVNDALTVDVASFTNLTAEERAVAQGRQDTLTNKANVGLHFAEKFGAASNITATGDITQDPAYLAAQAAIKNVTADPATAAAAEGRIDIAVGTSDPVGSLVGQNSALTAALFDLQAKTVAEAQALEALALADNAADAAPITDAALLEKFVTDFDDAAALAAVSDANSSVADAQKDVADSTNALTAARALNSDVALKTAATQAQTAVDNDSAVKALQVTANNAKTALASTTDLAVLTAVQDALSAYVKAGGLVSTELNDTTNVTVGDLVNQVNAVLNLKVGVDGDAAFIAAAQKTLVENFLDGADNAFVVPVSTPATASETALQTAITKAEARDAAYDASVKADLAFSTEGSGKGAALLAAEAAVTARDGQIKAVADAAAAVTKEQADQVKVVAAYDAHTAASDKVVAAEKAIADLGYNVGTLTPGKDLFVADAAKVGVAGTVTIGAGFATGDELFIGTQYKFGGATDATKTISDLYAAGNASALEVFFEQSGANTIVHVEAKAFANAGAAPANDVANIVLTGVNANTLTFENGFVHVA